jgi:tetratricopeptide (TPR) repeat protein
MGSVWFFDLYVHVQLAWEYINFTGLSVPLIESLKSKAHLSTEARKRKNLTHLQRVLLFKDSSAMQKTLMPGRSLVVFALILIVGIIWFTGSKLKYINRETALAHPIPTAESKPAPTPTGTASLLVPFSPRVNWERVFGYAALHSIRGLDFYKKSDYDRAIKEYTDAIKLDSNNDFANASAYYYRGLAYYHKYEYNEAIRDLNRAILLNPTKATAYYYRGVVYYHKNEYDNAIRDFNEAIFLDPSDPTAYYYRGVAYHELRKNAQAQADFDKAKQLGYAGQQ